MLNDLATTPAKRSVRLALAALLSVLLAFGMSMWGPLSGAHATQGITSTLLLNGATYNGNPVVTEGDTVTLRVQYDNSVAPGSTVNFVFSSNVAVTSVPSGNAAIDSVTQTGNVVGIKFKDPWPPAVNQGVFDIQVKVADVESSELTQLTWKIDGEETKVTVIVKNTGDTFANVTESFAKAVSPSNLDSYVKVVNGVVTLDDSVLTKNLDYTLTVNSPTARTNFPVSDVLPAGLSYVTGSFTGELTSWDANGLNQTVNPGFGFTPTITGNTFMSNITVPGPSILKIKYQAQVMDATNKALIEAQLQTAYNAQGGVAGNFEVNLKNTASFDTVTKDATVRFRGSIPGVSIGSATAKFVDWKTKNVEAAADGTLTPPADITYTLAADLRMWTGVDPNFTLNQNMVIRDTLPSQLSWKTGDPAFITPSGIALTQEANCPTNLDDFTQDVYVGKWCITGQTLVVNIGKSNANYVSVAAKAQVNTVAGLPQEGSTTVKDATPYLVRNTASFYYRIGNPHNTSVDSTVVVLPKTDQGLNDTSAFTKEGAVRNANLNPGDAAIVDYTFKAKAGAGIDAANSSIVDHVDTTLFDISNLGSLPVAGSYNGVALTAADYALSTNAAGELVIVLSTSGKAIVAAQGADKEWVTTLTLTTFPFDGKVTHEITNKATLFGSDSKPKFWSEASGQATSFGDEAEVRKRVFDTAASAWDSNVDVVMDGTGGLTNDIFTYRVQFIPHGSYNGVTIVPVVDTLPAAVEFIGFVSEADAGTDTGAAAGPIDIGGNLQASYAAGKVTISQKPGTVLDATKGPIETFFSVRVNDPSAPIVNEIGATSATITPIRQVSVGDFVWLDSNRNGLQDPGEKGIKDVVLTLVGPDGGPVTDVFGNPVGPQTTDANGYYSFDHLPALTGTQTYTVKIDQVASEPVLRPYVPTLEGVGGDRGKDSSTWHASTLPGELHQDGDRDPTLDFGFVTKTYAVGDYVWIDANSNGLQDPGEKPLAGVKVELFDELGTKLAETTTNADGRYIFDELGADKYQIRFTLTDAQKEIYAFTKQQVGSDPAIDSNANPADGWTVKFVLDDSNTSLTTSYTFFSVKATQGIDPTWDAGVVLLPPKPEGLTKTGAEAIGAGVLIAGALLVTTGGVLLIRRRRNA